MDWEKLLYNDAEKPLDSLVDGYSHTSVFRTVAFIGDSLSSGEFQTCDETGKSHYYDLFEYSWGQYIARKNGLTAYNFSRGGMTAKEYVESFAEAKGYWDADKACQAYVIALGVNDIIGKGMEIGSIGDVKNPDPGREPTFLQYYAEIVKKYKSISPAAKFFFVTFPNETNPRRNANAPQMVQALYDLAAYFDNAYVIDLYRYGPVYDERFVEKFFMYGHMTPSGYILTAQLIDSYIDYIVRHNPEDFKTAGFIGTDIPY